ncbi:MAG: alpha/beta hydrolase [Treponema sp.]|nr:alpha/beta hydrolase [Treponema sp.]MCL2237556.1 alpha/beta hydrolase [Treponema sp.]
MAFTDFQQLSFHNLDCEINYWYKKGNSDNYIILLHGAGCDHLMFEKQVGIFDKNHNLIAWDARGHGLSKLNGKKFNFYDMYDDCLKLLQKHKIDKATFIGQSMGGNLAQEMAYNNQNLIDKLILIDCTRNTQKLTLLEKYSIKYSRIIFNCYPWKTLIRQSANACGNAEYTKNYVRSCFEKMEKEAFIEIMMSLFQCLHEDQKYKYNLPVLLICGKNDKAGNIKKSMKIWAKEDDSCRLCMIENAGHNSNQDNPDDVNDRISLFLKE